MVTVVGAVAVAVVVAAVGAVVGAVAMAVVVAVVGTVVGAVTVAVVATGSSESLSCGARDVRSPCVW